jgi:hypothetical protein
VSWAIACSARADAAAPAGGMAVNMIKLTNEREIDPYLWEHPNNERWRPPVRRRVFSEVASQRVYPTAPPRLARLGRS